MDVQWSERDLAYFAGIVDGEGCFCLHNAGTHRFASQLQVGNTDARLMEWIRSHFGGTVNLEKRHSSRHKSVWRWTARAADLDEIIPALLPHLIIKKQQAELFLAYRKTVAQMVRSGRATAKTADSVKQERHRIHSELVALNRRGAA